MTTTTAFSPGAAQRPTARRRVVDAPTRTFHWLFALSFAGAYLTAGSERFRLLHVTLGYTMAGLLVFRVLYGLRGPRQAGLTLLWRKVSGLWPWVQSVHMSAQLNARRAAPAQPAAAVNWRQGQNLFMALAIMALLVTVLPLTLSGYASYNDWGDFWGGDWVARVHDFFGNTLLVVVLVHIAAVVGLSLLRRKNLVAPMLSGHMDGAGPDLAKRNHLWLAVLLVAAVLAYWTWEWQQSPQGLIPMQSIPAFLRGPMHNAFNL
jgi:cytochrome b